MDNTYYDYLQTLSKGELIDLIYKPFKPNRQHTGISKRKIALKLSYHGKNYSGVQCHKHILSIGECLQNALNITGLGYKFVFCGRTDAGVSAINMVVSLDAISRLENPNRTYDIIDSDYDEYPYDIMLNRILPDDIRITGWAPVPDEFNARYDCIQRHYKYFFCLNQKNLYLMEEAAQKILKMDDFYCLSTHSNPKVSYKRKIDEIKISKVNIPIYFPLITKNNLTGSVSDLSSDIKSIDLNERVNPAIKLSNESQHEWQKQRTKNLRIQYNETKTESRTIEDDLYCLDIKARGFLHNMVRKIFWVIENCGKGHEFSLKNVEIADAYPLVFVGCKFKNKLNFIGNKYNTHQFKKEEERSRIDSAICQLRYHVFDLDLN